MARDAQHDYMELSDMAGASDGTAAERVYEPNSTSSPAASGSIRRGLSSLLHSPEFRKHILTSASLALLWYIFSGLLSVYNKWLFGKTQRNFPFPLFVSSIHMFAQYILAMLCLRLFPSLRPSQSPTWGTYLTRAVPCGMASAMDVGLSNISLQTITLTFYTMCKSSSLGFVLLFAFLFGLERVRLVLIVIIAIISIGVMLMVAGEVDFVLSGFIEAITSSAMSGLRWSLTQILLSQSRFGMNNPIATMSKLTPITGITMFLFSLALEHPFTEISKNQNMNTRQGAVFIAFMMIGGGILAFGMVLSEFFLISRTSVVTLSIAGMLKEVVMIGVAHLVFGDKMTLVNASGLLVALFGIGMYNWLKLHDTLNDSSKKSSYESSDTAINASSSIDDPQQRRLVFESGAYDEMAGMGVLPSDDWTPQSRSNGNGSDGGNIARRRQSVFANNSSSRNSSRNSGDSDRENSRTSKENAISLPDIRPSEDGAPRYVDAQRSSQSSSLNMDRVISQEHQYDSSATRLKQHN
ncbi:hypothetical protein GGI12_001760 [Dipsacomyces acuminosporus]|nr:hypothetical protein GGI12_001760 [Dipsacomyces acuminosporus]